ncbi:MAG: hypothetical protein ACYDHQ_00215 [Coriobacteriia bacterium]
MSAKRVPLRSVGEPKRLTIRLTPDDYDRLSALAANDGVAMAVKGREVMLAGMDPQIFGECYYDVERLLRGVVKAEMETHSERLHKRLYRIGGISAAMVFFVREILGRAFEFPPQAVNQLWREAEGQGFKYMGQKQPGSSMPADREGEGSPL